MRWARCQRPSPKASNRREVRSGTCRAAGHEKALEAQARADALQQLMDAHDWHDNAAADLRHAVRICVASSAQAAGLDQEALGIFRALAADASVQMPSRAHVNLGNLCAGRGAWVDAIKQYRMALDQIPTERQARGPRDARLGA